jgi:DNA-binding NarL/FixJ family response regulator
MAGIEQSVIGRASLLLRVFLIEDSLLLRQALEEMLDELDRVALVGSADTERDSLAGLEETTADLVIVDLALREGTGLGVLSALAKTPERFHSPTAVVLSNHAYPQMRERCARLGAAAFFDKSLQLPDLIEFIRARCGE